MAIFYNQATLSYNGGVVRSNIATGELLSALSATKTAVVDEYSENSDVTYAVNIINSGTTDFTGLTVTDDLGGYEFNSNTLYPLDYVDGSLKYFVNGVLQSEPAVNAGPPLVISGISVPAGGVATLLYTARVNSFAPLDEDDAIVNTVVVSGNCITMITATETITAATGVDLRINKSLNPTTVVEGDRLTYTFLIRNYGNTAVTVADNVVVTDNFDPILSDLTVTFNGNPWTSPANYTYNEATGLFQTVAGQITVPAATYSQNPVTGEWVTTPGSVTLTVSGTV